MKDKKEMYMKKSVFKECQLEIFKTWVESHREVLDDEDNFWYVQNAVGNILEWPKEYIDYVKSLDEEEAFTKTDLQLIKLSLGLLMDNVARDRIYKKIEDKLKDK